MRVSRPSLGVSASGMSPNARRSCFGDIVQRPVIPESQNGGPAGGARIRLPAWERRVTPPAEAALDSAHRYGRRPSVAHARQLDGVGPQATHHPAAVARPADGRIVDVEVPLSRVQARRAGNLARSWAQLGRHRRHRFHPGRKRAGSRDLGSRRAWPPNPSGTATFPRKTAPSPSPTTTAPLTAPKRAASWPL